MAQQDDLKRRTLWQEVAAELLERFPKAPSLTLAKRLYRENVALFTNVEAARSCIRLLRGASGRAKRKSVRQPVRQSFRTKEESEKAKIMPKSIELPESDAKPYTPYEITGVNRVGVMNDTHIPYHDKRAIETAVGALRKARVELLLLNGDVQDCHALSRWERDPRKRRFKDELELTSQFFTYVRSKLRCPIVWKLGNHEQRYFAYMMRKAPELLDFDKFDPKAVFGLADSEATIVGEDRLINFDKLTAIHGHEFPRAMIGPVNAARGFFIKAHANVIGAHHHQSSTHIEPDIQGRDIGAWSVGCLCHLHPEYARLNRWSHGYAIVETTSEGFEVDNRRIGRE